MGRKKKSETVIDKTAKFHRWFQDASDGHRDNRSEADKDEAFYMGDQWSADDKAILDREKRPHLVFNEIFPIVNLVSGFQRQNRSDVKAFNVKGGTRKIADIITKLIKHIMYHSDGHFESSRQFEDGIIGGEGYMVLDIDYTNDVINGDIAIKRVKRNNIYIDPHHESYDMSDAKFAFICEWVDKDRIKEMFPKKAGELDGATIDSKDTIKVNVSNDYTPTTTKDPGTIGVEEYRWRVKKCWWREQRRVTFLLKSTGEFENLTDSSPAEIKKLKDDTPDAQIISRVIEVLWYTTLVGNVVLEEIERPLGEVSMYPIIPFYAYWRNKHKFGIIKNLRDPQQEKNKRYSQMLHILNTTAHSGWLIEEQSVDDINKYKNYGSTPGMTLTYKAGFAKPERLIPAHASQGHMMAAKVGGDELKMISGINTDLLGVSPSNSQVESGIAISRRQQQGIMILQNVFDNFNRSQIHLGKLLVEYIQKSGAYSEDEVLNIVGEDDNIETVRVNESVPEGDGIKEVLNDVRVGKYGVMIGQGAYNVTTRVSNLMYLVEAAKSGVPIPADVLIDATDLPDKDKIKQRIQQEQTRQERLAMMGQGKQGRPQR